MILKEFLNTYNIEIKWLAAYIGIGRSRLANYKSGYSNPDKETLELIEKKVNKLRYDYKRTDYWIIKMVR